MLIIIIKKKGLSGSELTKTVETLRNGVYNARVAAQYLNDSLKYRKPQKKILKWDKKWRWCGLTPFWAYKIHKSPKWKQLVFIMIWINIGKTLWEPPGFKITPNVCVVHIYLFILS